MPLHHKAYIFIILCLFCFSCKEKNTPPVSRKNPFDNKESFIRANQYLVKQDEEKIKGYIERRGWEMQQTKSGLSYMIIEKGTGKKVTLNKKITCSYSITLLDGTACYSSDKDGNKEFITGKGGVESGLEEGVLLLRVGDNAKFIMPPHLAHGLLGDENKIPPRSIIVYDVKILSISEP